MKNFKSTMRTLFISTILAAICSTFFAANFAYAVSATGATGVGTGTSGGSSTTDPAAPGFIPTPPNPKNDLTEGTFNVKENLSLDPTGGSQPKSYLNNNNPNSPIVTFVITIIDFAITIMGSIAVILFIVAGFMFMASNGNSQKLDEAKDIMKYAAIGLIVALLSYVITIFVQSIFSNG